MRKNELRKWRENYTPYTGECLAEGVRLNVHFEEKEYVKDLGAKWQPDLPWKGGYWWMPMRQLSRQPDSNTPSVVNIFEAGRERYWRNNHRHYHSPMVGRQQDALW